MKTKGLLLGTMFSLILAIGTLNAQSNYNDTDVQTVRNSANVTYTVAAGMDSYTWTVTGGTIVSGDGTNSIVVQWPTTNRTTANAGAIEVYGTTNGCNSPTITIDVNAWNAISAAANNLSSASICSGEALTFDLVLEDGNPAKFGYKYIIRDPDGTVVDETASFTEVAGATANISIAAGVLLNTDTADKTFEIVITEAYDGFNEPASVDLSGAIAGSFTVKGTPDLGPIQSSSSLTIR